MQSYTAIPSSQSVTSSLLLLLDNDLTAISNSSGTTFPTTNLQVGMFCFRTDTGQVWQLISLTGGTGGTPQWILVLDTNHQPLFADSTTVTGGSIIIEQGGSTDSNVAIERLSTGQLSLLTASGQALLAGLSGSILASNAYFDGTNWQRWSTSVSSAYLSLSQSGVLSTAAAAAATGTITWGATSYFPQSSTNPTSGTLTFAQSIAAAGYSGATYSLANGTGAAQLSNDANTNNFKIRTGPSSAYVYTTVDASGNMVVPGSVTAASLIANGGTNTGVVYLGSSETYYLQYTGTTYYMPAGPLQVGGVLNPSNGAFSVGTSVAIGLYADGSNLALRLQNQTGTMYFQTASGAATMATIDHSGNGYFAGNVTAYSDIRRKTDIKRLEHVTNRLLAMEHGGISYLDKHTGQRKLGVSAQDIDKAGFSEAVMVDENGELSVAYGQLAMATLIEALREQREINKSLMKRLDALEGK